MAIIYSYPQINSSSDLAASDLMIISDMSANGKPTKALKLSDLATFITNTGTGSGTTNKIPRWSDGPSGVLGDSILAQDALATQLTLTGNFIATGTGNFTGQVTIPTTPAAATDAASKNYVDTEVAGIPAGLVFKGNWNANTNTPALASGTGTVGNYYVVSVAGNTNLDGITDWQVGDWAVFVEVGGVDKWDKIDQTFVSGSGAAGQVTFWNTINTVDGDNDFYWDNVNKRLGIGTTSPDSLLEISSGTTTDFLKLTSTGSNASPAKIIFEKSATEQGIVEYVRNGDLRIYNTDGDGGVLIDGSSASGNDLYVKNDGNVGIGTASPSEKLDVAGNIRWTGNAINGGNGNLIMGGGQIKFSDAGRFFMGDSNDLQIYHDGTNSVINNTTGHLQIYNNADDQDIVFICDDGSGGTTEYFRVDGGATTVAFSKTITQVDSKYIALGNSFDFHLQHNGTNSIITNSTGNLEIRQNTDDADIVFYSDNGLGGTTEYFRVDGSLEEVIFSKSTRHMDNVQAKFGSGEDLKIYHTGSTSLFDNLTGNLVIQQSANDSDIIFKSDDGSGGTTEYFRLDGNTGYSIASKDIYLIDDVRLRAGTGGDFSFFHDGSNSKINNNTGNIVVENFQDDGDISFKTDDGSGGTTEYFRLDGGDKTTVVSEPFRFQDNIKLKFGASSDIQIYSDNSNSIFDFFNLNNVIFRQHFLDGDMTFQSDNGSGGVTTYFKLDGGNERLQVSAPNGMLFSDNIKAKFGTGGDLQIYHDGSNSYIDETGTGDLIVKAIDDVYIRGNTHDMGRFNEQGVKFYYLGNVKLETNNTGVRIPTAGNGLQLVSPNGTVYTVTVDNSGNLVVT